MEPLHFSFIIPVYNRPEEIEELLESFTKLEGHSNFDIVIIDDGSSLKCQSVVDSYHAILNIEYYFKKNSGPGDSRNYGMLKAKGNYFIILDSDCLLPHDYLTVVIQYLEKNYVDCYGGPDRAHRSFTNLQKAINFAMTSFLTTGGIRGGKKDLKDFQPRSFNMGISKAAFLASKGFGQIHPGEDPDLAIRLKKLGFATVLIPEAYVYHKRRVSWSKFFNQVYKFGLARPILNQWHPETTKLIYWLPTFFVLGLVLAIVLMLLNIFWPFAIYVLYSIVAFAIALYTTGKLDVALKAVVAIYMQFLGYGYGFLNATLKLICSQKSPEQQFPNLFFKHGK